MVFGNFFIEVGNSMANHTNGSAVLSVHTIGSVHSVNPVNTGSTLFSFFGTGREH